MTKKEKYSKLITYLDDIRTYYHALALISFDQQTISPKKAYDAQSETLSKLANKVFKITQNQEYVDLLSVEFDAWKDNMVAVYDEYNAFYQMVKGADIESHDTIYKNVVRVTYTNGVVVYVNYAKRPYMVDGNLLQASSYLIENN